MKKLLLLLYCSVISVTFAQPVQSNPDLSYYPIQDGNYFEYYHRYTELPFPDDTSAYSLKILHDTTLSNGKIYKILLRKDILLEKSGQYEFERIDTVTGCVYRYGNNDLSHDNEYMIDSLFAAPGNVIHCSRTGITSFGNFSTTCFSTEADTILNFPTEVKSFIDQSFTPGLNYQLAKGLGVISSSSCEGGCGYTFLHYAEINGKIFGTPITAVAIAQPELPEAFALLQNYPNPFNPSTVIGYVLGEESNVSLKIYDVLGKEIATLVDAKQIAGKYSVNFDAAKLNTGMYFYQLKTGRNSVTKSMLLLK
ncbi:MAG: T9SS type A sorting domain-containing protein [Ignavibacteriales bacterium]|nr:T9SS type A sorting domain-containing protein [Ignavibacteriales bacterium]